MHTTAGFISVRQGHFNLRTDQLIATSSRLVVLLNREGNYLSNMGSLSTAEVFYSEEDRQCDGYSSTHPQRYNTKGLARASGILFPGGGGGGEHTVGQLG